MRPQRSSRFHAPHATQTRSGFLLDHMTCSPAETARDNKYVSRRQSPSHRKFDRRFLHISDRTVKRRPSPNSSHSRGAHRPTTTIYRITQTKHTPNSNTEPTPSSRPRQSRGRSSSQSDDSNRQRTQHHATDPPRHHRRSLPPQQIARSCVRQPSIKNLRRRSRDT